MARGCSIPRPWTRTLILSFCTLAPSATVAPRQGAEVEGDGKSSRAAEKEEELKNPPARAGPSSAIMAAVGPRPTSGERTPLSTGWLSEASDKDG
jgi:hypothetical protein